MKFKKIIRKIILYTVLCVTLASHASGVFAFDEGFYGTNDVIYFDPDAVACAPPGSSTTLIGDSNEEKAWNFFIAKGLTPEQTAGIIGNLMQESGMIPDNQENNKPWPTGGWGIAQWTGSRRTDISKAVIGAGLPYTNESTPADKIDPLLAFELDYLWQEATDRGDIAKLKNETTVEGAVISWERNFEIAGNPVLGNRLTLAQSAYDKYASSTASAGSDCNAGGVAIDGFVYYSQYDPAFANSPYGSSTVRESGCGPTSMAMVVATLTGNTGVTPKVIAGKYGGYNIPGAGSSHSLFGAVASDYGLDEKPITTEADVKSILQSGGLIVAAGTGADPYTDIGHIVVIRGISSGGAYLVGNPLPSPSWQGKSSVDVQKNDPKFKREYTWVQLSSGASGAFYAITKKGSTL